MVYNEKIMDLFSVPDEYYLAHCISADFALGKGIAKEFDRRFGVRQTLKRDFSKFFADDYQDGACIRTGRVLNLVTKEKYYQKPTYKSLEQSLQATKNICLHRKVQKIAMPMIGCGLDKLEWDRVSQIIKNIFGDTDMEILVCKIR